MKLSDLPQEFVDLYNLTKIAEDNGNVYIKVQKGMYGLPQAGILAHRLLEQWLNEQGYQESQVTPGLWKHALRPISFTHCVNNFVLNTLAKNTPSTCYKFSTCTTSALKIGTARNTSAWTLIGTTSKKR